MREQAILCSTASKLKLQRGQNFQIVKDRIYRTTQRAVRFASCSRKLKVLFSRKLGFYVSAVTCQQVEQILFCCLLGAGRPKTTPERSLARSLGCSLRETTASVSRMNRLACRPNLRSLASQSGKLKDPDHSRHSSRSVKEPFSDSFGRRFELRCSRAASQVGSE